MNLAIKISLLASGLFLLIGMLIGIVKHRRMLSSPDHMAPPYIDIAHRAAFLDSFAMLVIAKLLEYSPYSLGVQMAVLGLVLTFLSITIVGYFTHGLLGTENVFHKRNFSSTWYVYMLTIGEIAGLAIMIWGYISTQFLDASVASQ